MSSSLANFPEPGDPSVGIAAVFCIWKRATLAYSRRIGIALDDAGFAVRRHSEWRVILMKFPIVFALVISAAGSPLLAQWATLRTPGIPRTADSKPNLAAPTPRTADGKPDFSGLFTRVSSYDRNIIKDGNAGAVQPWAETLTKQRMETIGKDNPAVLCGPGGFRYLQRRRGERSQWNDAHCSKSRRDRLPASRPHLPYDLSWMAGSLKPIRTLSWMGYSVGHWDGDTLVVESNGYNPKTWLDSDGHPHSEALRMTERYRRTDFGHIELEATYSDPSVYSKPWTIKLDLRYTPDTELIEFVCSETKIYGEHLVGKASDEKKAEVNVDPKILAKYVGHYKELDVWQNEPVLRTIAVTTANGKLFAGSIGKPNYQLVAVSDNTSPASARGASGSFSTKKET